MINQERTETQVRLSRLTEYSIEVIQDFLSCYKKTAHANYLSAILEIFESCNKNDVKKLSKKDFDNIMASYNPDEVKTPQDSYKQSFFRFLFANSIMDDPTGFDGEWIQQEWRNHFEKLKKRNSITTINKVEAVESISLTFEELSNIQQTVARLSNSKDIKNRKMAFVWYMLFEQGLEVNEVKKIKGSMYKDGYIVTPNGEEIEIPDDFQPLLEHISGQVYDGFQTLNDLIKELGNRAGIYDLTPQKVKKAKKQNEIICGNCGKIYGNLVRNWVSINGRIVCLNCAEILKKKLKTDIQPFLTIDHSSNTENYKGESVAHITIFSRFETLREKIPKKVDYLKLHEFQIMIGNLGEAYVFDKERKKLINTPYFSHVEIKSESGENGYDILSFCENGEPIFIEVKTTIGKEQDFYITDYEIKKAKQFASEGKKYFIYRVSNILASNREEIYFEIITLNELFDDKKYSLSPYNWKVRKL